MLVILIVHIGYVDHFVMKQSYHYVLFVVFRMAVMKMQRVVSHLPGK